MKKIALLLMILLTAGTAFAAKPMRSGLYIGTKVGAMRTIMKDAGEKKDDIVFPFALALGLRIRHFRIEAEYVFSTRAKHDNYEQETEMVSGQLYWDIPFKAPIRPFANVGVGRHNTKAKETKSENRNAYNEKYHGWAWNVGGGLTWAVSNAVNIDLGYRYFDIGSLRTQNGTIKTQHHFVYISWRYVF